MMNDDSRLPGTLPLDHGLFGRLRRDVAEDWARYLHHPFLKALGRGTLPMEGFRRYLIQDYLYLIHYARGYALSGYKSERLDEIRAASRALTAILDVELPLHIAFCQGWGLTESEMAATPEDLRMLAYTRFFLERGLSGDKLDLEVALAPCIAGYAEIGALLRADPETVMAGNPYAPWIESYSSEAFQAAAAQAILAIDRLGAERGAVARYPSLLTTFRAATRLEAEFWGIGWPKEQV
jgi:thiaminase/transcriptional activator TenA